MCVVAVVRNRFRTCALHGERWEYGENPPDSGEFGEFGGLA